MDTQPTVLGTLVNIFLEPKKALGDIRGHNGWLWLPLIIVVALGVGFQLWYLHIVDFGWLVDQTLAPKAADMTADQLRAAHDRMTPGSFTFFGVVGTLIGVPVWYAIQALYFFMAAKLGGYKDQAYGTWFSFISWTSFIGILGYVASGAYLLSTSSRQISFVDVDVSSLNTLLFHVPYAHKGQALLSSLRITTLWSWVIMTLGLAQWTGKSVGRAAFTVLLPYVVCYVIWGVIAVI